MVHVLDRNDNVPQFLELDYRGFISEAAPVGSLVLAADTSPLALKARDNDFELNALLQYEIVEAAPKRMFYVVSNTGTYTAPIVSVFEKFDHSICSLCRCLRCDTYGGHVGLRASVRDRVPRAGERSRQTEADV